jgi:uncharacterized protein
MTSPLSENWGRYALLVDIAARLYGKKTLGKKALQKLVYLLQELEHVPLGYRFRFFTYGPFSDDLAYTLDVVESMGGLNVAYDQGANAYEITPGPAAARLTEKGKDLLSRYHSAVDRLVERFGEHTAKELELIATIVYLLDKRGDMNVEALTRAVLELKPKYDDRRVRRAVEDLLRIGYLC